MSDFDRARLIEADWEQGLSPATSLYTAEINIYAYDSQGLIFKLTKLFNEENINLTGLNVRLNKQGRATVNVKFQIHSKEQLNKVIDKIRNIEGIIDIERTSG